MLFEWDPEKDAKNFKKHGISFKEAATVFGDPFALTFNDPIHSKGEHRYLTVGMSQKEQLLIISHTDRNDRIRIISARRVTRQERKFYEEENPR